MGGPSGERGPAFLQMAPRPSSASAGAPLPAIRARILPWASSGRTPRQSASPYKSRDGLYW
eukprot:11599828-Alexandrium_andersonii.AAC.1